MSVCRTPMKPSLRKWKKFSWLLMLNRMAGRSSQASHLRSVVTGLEKSSQSTHADESGRRCCMPNFRQM